MIIFGLFSWWYSTGWLAVVKRCSERIQAVLGFFSVPLLITSLFAPFRQISAGKVQGSVEVQLRAFGDRLFSRFMGAIIRSMLIVIGLIVVALAVIISVVVIIAWPVLPFAPLVGLAFTVVRG